MSKARCYQCEFFHDNQCKRLENALGSCTDIKCLIKMQTLMLNNIGQMIFDYMSDGDFDEDDGEGTEPK